MKFTGLIRLTDQPVCTVLIDGELKEQPLQSLTVPKGALAVLLPSTEILLTKVHVPSTQRQKVLQAAPYALEENLAEDIEDLHFALGQRDADGAHAIAVIRHSRMQQYLDSLQAQGIYPRWVIPDVLGVPLPDNGWGIVLLGGLALVRTGAQQGFAVEQDLLSLALQRALDIPSSEQPERICVHRSPRSDLQLSAADSQGIEIETVTHERGTMHLLLDTLQARGAQPLNLWQGRDYTGNDRSLYQLWKPWRLTTALAACLGLLWLGQALYETQQWQQTLKDSRAETRRLFKQAFPDVQRIVNPKVQMERRLAALQGAQQGDAQQAGLLQVLNRIAPALAQAKAVQVHTFDYREQRLDLRLHVPNFTDLESLTQRLKALGLNVDMRKAENRQQGVEARLRVSLS